MSREEGELESLAPFQAEREKELRAGSAANQVRGDEGLRLWQCHASDRSKAELVRLCPPLEDGVSGREELGWCQGRWCGQLARRCYS